MNEKERPAKSTITQKKIGEREIRKIGDSNGLGEHQAAEGWQYIRQQKAGSTYWSREWKYMRPRGPALQQAAEGRENIRQRQQRAGSSSIRRGL